MWHEVFDVWYDVTFENLEKTVRGCTDDLWRTSMWDVAKDPERPRAVVSDGSSHPLGNDVLATVWKVVWHALVANEFNLAGRPADFRLMGEFAHLDARLNPGVAGDGEVVPIDPPSRDDLVAYLRHNRELVTARLDAARDVGDGQSRLGPWTGPTSTLLYMFHGNACHLVSHTSEVVMFLWQHR